MERDVKKNDHIPEDHVSEMTGDKLIAHYRAVEGTPEGVPSNEDVPIFPHVEQPGEENDA